MLYFGSRYNITETFLYETVNKPGVNSQTNKRSIMYHVAIIIIPAEITSRLITHIYLFNDRLSHLKIYTRFSVLTVDLLLINREIWIITCFSPVFKCILLLCCINWIHPPSTWYLISITVIFQLHWDTKQCLLIALSWALSISFVSIGRPFELLHHHW